MSGIRLPNITETSEAGQILQIKSYLHQLVGDLEYALATAGSTANTNSVVYRRSAGTSGGAAVDPVVSFQSIKSLIIKSADIVNAYYEEFNKRFSGNYVAQSDFGTFSEQTQNAIKANSTSIEQFYSNLQQIVTDIENLEHSLIEVNAHIFSGLLYYDEKGIPVYGLEIGQRSQIDGVEVFNKYARFTSDKLSFYNSAGHEVAYISDRKLYITHIEVIGTFTEGGFVDTVLPDGSIVTRWVARGGGS